MKDLVIFLFLLAFLAQGHAKKVCILFESKVVPTTTTTVVGDEISVMVNKEIPVTEDSFSITPGDVSAVTEEISALIETEETLTETEMPTPTTSNATKSTAKVCTLEAITLFDDQNDLLRKMCPIKPGSSPLYVVTIQNSVVRSDLSLATLCSEGPRGLLSWISWQDFIDKVKPFLRTDEHPPLVVRNLSIWTTDESSSEVLIEMLPIRYKLVNMTPSAWTNNTFIKTVSFGSIEFENAKDEAQHIKGELNYSFPIETNTTFLSSYPIKGLPVEMSDESDERKNFVVGSGTSYVFQSTFAVERLVPGLKKETVSLKGTFGIHEYDIDGKIVSIFGVNGDGSPIEESHQIRARVVSRQTYDIQETFKLEGFTTTTTMGTTKETDGPTEAPISLSFKSGPIYPGFKKFFYVALFLVFGTVLIVAVDIVRKSIKDMKAKSQARRTYEKIVS